MIIKETLKLADFSLDAEVLLLYSLKHENIKTLKQITKTFLYSNPDLEISSKTEKIYKKLISRRKKGEPLAYLINHKEFYNLDFYIDKNVLIPRPETELLVEEALSYCSSRARTINLFSSRPRLGGASNNKIRILDIGTGSGCIIIATAKSLCDCHSRLDRESRYQMDPRFRGDDTIDYYAADISDKALKIAQKNAKKHKVKINFIKSDLFNNISNQLKFDLIVANLPYLWDKLPQFEPKMALSGGKNGLEIINRFLEEAKNYLSPKGAIIIEFDPRQAQTIKNIAKNIYPDKKISLKKDLRHLDRTLIISYS